MTPVYIGNHVFTNQYVQLKLKGNNHGIPVFSKNNTNWGRILIKLGKLRRQKGQMVAEQTFIGPHLVKFVCWSFGKTINKQLV